MRNRNPKIVEIVSDYGPNFCCKNCGVEWIPMIKPGTGGLFYRNGWQCPNGCRA